MRNCLSLNVHTVGVDFVGGLKFNHLLYVVVRLSDALCPNENESSNWRKFTLMTPWVHAWAWLYKVSRAIGICSSLFRWWWKSYCSMFTFFSNVSTHTENNENNDIYSCLYINIGNIMMNPYSTFIYTQLPKFSTNFYNNRNNNFNNWYS